MRKILLLLLMINVCGSLCFKVNGQTAKSLRIVIIRHGEKDATGDNLNCQGMNRALQIPKVIVSKYGVPAMVYVPSLNTGKSTTHARMFQTASPLAIKYNLTINSKYEVEDYDKLAANLEEQKGTLLVVWEHEAIVDIAKALGIKTKGFVWPGDDFDSIWVITYKNGTPVLTKDKEGLKPGNACSY